MKTQINLIKRTYGKICQDPSALSPIPYKSLLSPIHARRNNYKLSLYTIRKTLNTTNQNNQQQDKNNTK